MIKKILQLSLLVIIGLLVVAMPVLAVSVTQAVYIADVVAYNTGTAITNGVATVVPINTQALIDGKYVTSDLLNTAIQTSGGSDVPYMPGVGTNPWVFFVPSIGQGEQKSYLFYAGGAAMQTGFYYFPASGGMTSVDNDTSLELGSNFQIEQKGYVDTSGSVTGYPSVLATNASTSTSGTSHAVNLPSGIQIGDLLLVFFATSATTAAPTITWSSGWTSLFYQANGLNNTLSAGYRIADGTEGSTITVTTSNAQTSSHQSFRIINYGRIPQFGTAATGASAVNPDPPSLTPTWGAFNDLWLAVCCDSVNVTAYPTSYSSGAVTGTVPYLASARRNLNAATENPGTFTAASGNWIANTISIKADALGLVAKRDAFKTYASASENITSAIMYSSMAATNTSTSPSGTSHTVSLPSGIVSGNLLLVFFGLGGQATVTFPGGWTSLFTASDDSPAYTLSAGYRTADGTEGSTITVTTSAAGVGRHQSFRIENPQGVPQAGSAAQGTSSTPDPPNLTPSGGTTDYLWFAVCCALNEVTAYPTNYTGGAVTGTSGPYLASAMRSLNAPSENPGVFTAAGPYWIANTIAVKINIDIAKVSATVTGVSNGELIVKTTADGTNMTLSVTNYSGTHQGNSPQSVALTGAGVPNNANNWSFATNGSIVYLDYHKIWIGGTAPANLKQHIVYERDTVFDDLTDNNNDATPTFVTTSSDPDVTATFQNFRPIKEAVCTAGLTEETPEMLTTPPEMPTEFYTEGSVNHLPGAELVNNLLDAGGIPQDLFWIPFCFGLAAVASVLGYYFLRSMFFIAIIGGVIILFFAATGAIPLWTFLIYAIIAGGVLVSERTFGW